MSVNQLISIIIPTYNRAHVIRETLDSIIAQTYKHWECIIVDDGSTDNTRRIVEDCVLVDSRFKLLTRPTQLQKGPSACRNYGVSQSSGKYIQFFDSDDIMHPDHLKFKINTIEDCDFVTCKIEGFYGDFDVELYKEDRVKDLIKPSKPFRSFVVGEFLMCMVVPFWKKESLEPFLPIREDLHILEDRELHTRILYTEPKFKVINKTLIYYRRDQISSTNSFFSNVDYGIDSYLKALESILLFVKEPEDRKVILKRILGFFRQALAERNFKAASKCLFFTEKFNLWNSSLLKLKNYRIRFFFHVLKIVKRGDTRFKFLFKI